MRNRQTDPQTASTDSVRAVDRALDILQAFRPDDRALPVAELLRRVDLSRPTLYRLLATLQQRGFLIGSGEPQRFRLGPAVAQLAHAWRSTLSLPEAAQPALQRLWAASQETASLFVRDDVQRVCLAEIESPQPLRFRRGVGYRERLARGASGRAILAHTELDSATRTRLYRGLSVNADEQAQELAAIRRRGYATSRDELIEGAVAIAAPFFDAQGVVVGALAVFGPSVRLKDKRVAELGALLKTEAARLSRELGDVR